MTRLQRRNGHETERDADHHIEHRRERRAREHDEPGHERLRKAAKDQDDDAPEDRKDYGELREIGYVVIGERLYCVVFTQRGETFRVFSLRKANNREIDRYEQATQIDP